MFSRTLHGEKICLVAPSPQYSTQLNQLITESFMELSATMAWATHKPVLAETEQVLKIHEKEFKESISLNYLLLNAQKQLIGTCGSPRMDQCVPKFELGYWLTSSETGNGYVTEAVNLLSTYLLTEKNAARIEIKCDELNIASWRVAEKCGFELEATIKNDRRNPMGKLSSTRLYAKFPV